GPVHGGVGATREGLEVIAIPGVKGDANGGGNHQRVVPYQAGFAQLGEQLLGPVGGRAGVGEGQQQEEFVPTLPRQGGAVPRHQNLQAAGDVPQQFVPHLVAHGVVDVLELVEVEKQQRQRLAGALHQVQGLLEAGGEGGPVGQSGEHVEIGQL